MSVQQNLEADFRAMLIKYGFVKAEEAYQALAAVAADLRNGAQNLSGSAIPNVSQSLQRARNAGNALNPNRTGGASRPVMTHDGRDPRSQSIVGGGVDPATGASATPETATSPAPTPSAISQAQVQNPIGGSPLAVGTSTETTSVKPQPQQIHDTEVVGHPTPTYAPGVIAEHPAFGGKWGQGIKDNQAKVNEGEDRAHVKVDAVTGATSNMSGDQAHMGDQPGEGDSSDNVKVGPGSPTKHPVSPDNDEGESNTSNEINKNKGKPNQPNDADKAKADKKDNAAA